MGEYSPPRGPGSAGVPAFRRSRPDPGSTRARRRRRSQAATGLALRRPRLGAFGTVLLAALGVVVVVVAAGAAYASSVLTGLPDVNLQPVAPHSIIVYDRTGQVLAERSSDGGYHVVLTLDRVGSNNIDATLAAEDRDFYQHGAVNIPSAIRAALVDIVTDRPAQGGSTITQQVVKIELLSPERTIQRKIQEAFLAEKLEQRYSKNQILELYLNRVYYGHGAYGIGSAAKTYFGASLSADKLDVAQAAFLAGLLHAPSADDPATNFDAARGRQLYVLRQMVAMKAITPAAEAAAEKEDIKAELKYDTSYRVTVAPHFVDYILGRLRTTVGDANMAAGGYSVFTTLDPALQALAERSVAAGLAQVAYTGINNGDLLAARPDSGEILAWVGSADYNNAAIGGKFDVVTAPRQPGSSFKVYTYEAALRDRRITLASCLQDRPTNFNGYQPVDFDGKFMGTMPAARALVLSRNVPAVEVGQLEGMNHVVALAEAMGIKSPIQPYLSSAIGSSEVTMLEHLGGYQVFANQGYRLPLMSITKIVGASQGVVFSQAPGKQPGQGQVISPAEAYLLTDTLKAYQDQWSLDWHRQMAGKSGTSGNAQVGTRDAWMMAYNPNIVVGAWGGNTAAGGGGGSIDGFGTDIGRSVLADFINGLPAGYSQWYSRPSGIVSGPGGQDYLSGTETMKACQGGDQVPAPGPGAKPAPHGGHKH